MITKFIKSEWGMQGLIRLIKSNSDVKETFRVTDEEFINRLVDYVKVKYL